MGDTSELMTEASHSRRALAAALLIAAAGCSSPDDVLSDASIDVQSVDAASDASVDSATDRAASDAPASDVATGDAPNADVASPDVIAPMDVVAVDVVTPTDAGVDVVRTDAATPPDVITVDVARVDTGVVDVPAADTGCAGAFTVRVTAPTADQAIETCTVSGMPVYFNFTAVPSGPATSVEFAWRTPDGTLAPPPWPAVTAAPYVARRQVGGTMIDVPPLAVLSRRGTWQLEVVARDRCGRTAMATQPFTLIYTNRDCPNP